MTELVADVRGRKVLENGDLDAGIYWAGMARALIHDLPSCAELVDRMVAEAEAIIAGRLAATRH